MKAAILHAVTECSTDPSRAVTWSQEVKSKDLWVHKSFRLQSIAVERVEYRMARPVGACTSPTCLDATKVSLVNATIWGARERRSTSFKVNNIVRSLFTEQLNSILITQPVTSSYRVSSVFLPCVTIAVTVKGSVSTNGIRMQKCFADRLVSNKIKIKNLI